MRFIEKMAVIWIFCIITCVAALPNAIDNHRHPPKTDQPSEFDYDMQRIVTKLPKNMRHEILGGREDDDVGYFDVLGKSSDGKPTYIIENKDNKKYRVKIKPKSKMPTETGHVSNHGYTPSSNIISKNVADQYNNKQSIENYEHLGSNAFVSAPHVDYSKKYKRTKGRYTSENVGYTVKHKLKDFDFDSSKLFNSDSSDDDASDHKVQMKYQSREGPNIEPQNTVNYVKEWKEHKSHPQEYTIYKNKGKKNHYSFEENIDEHHVFIPNKHKYSIDQFSNKDSMQPESKGQAYSGENKNKKDYEFAVYNNKGKYDNSNSDNKRHVHFGENNSEYQSNEAILDPNFQGGETSNEMNFQKNKHGLHPQEFSIYKNNDNNNIFSFEDIFGQNHHYHHHGSPNNNEYNINHSPIKDSTKHTIKEQASLENSNESKEKITENYQFHPKEFAIDEKQIINSNFHKGEDVDESHVHIPSKNKYNLDQVLINNSMQHESKELAQSENANKNKDLFNIEHKTVETYFEKNNQNGTNASNFGDVNRNETNVDEKFTNHYDSHQSNILNPGQFINESFSSETNTERNDPLDGKNNYNNSKNKVRKNNYGAESEFEQNNSNSKDVSNIEDFLLYDSKQTQDKKFVPSSNILDRYPYENQNKGKGGIHLNTFEVHNKDQDNLKDFESNTHQTNVDKEMDNLYELNDSSRQTSNEIEDSQESNPFEYSVESSKNNKNKDHRIKKSETNNIISKFEGTKRFEDIIQICKNLKLNPKDIWLLAHKYFGLDIRSPKDFKQFKNLYAGFMSNLRNGTEAEYLKSVSKLITLNKNDNEISELVNNNSENDKLYDENIMLRTQDPDEYQPNLRNGPASGNKPDLLEEMSAPTESYIVPKYSQENLLSLLNKSENNQNESTYDLTKLSYTTEAINIPSSEKYETESIANYTTLNLPLRYFDDYETSLENTTEIEPLISNREIKMTSQPYDYLKYSDQRENDNLNDYIPNEPKPIDWLIPEIITKPIGEKDDLNTKHLEGLHNLNVLNPELNLKKVPLTISENEYPEINTAVEDKQSTEYYNNKYEPEYSEDDTKEMEKDTSLRNSDSNLAYDGTDSYTPENEEQTKQVEIKEPQQQPQEILEGPEINYQEDLEINEGHHNLNISNPDLNLIEESIEENSYPEINAPLEDKPNNEQSIDNDNKKYEPKFSEDDTKEIEKDTYLRNLDSNSAEKDLDLDISKKEDVAKQIEIEEPEPKSQENFEAPETNIQSDLDTLVFDDDYPQKNLETLLKDEVFGTPVVKSRDGFRKNSQEDLAAPIVQPPEATKKHFLEVLQAHEQYKPLKDEVSHEIVKQDDFEVPEKFSPEIFEAPAIDLQEDYKVPIVRQKEVFEAIAKQSQEDLEMAEKHFQEDYEAPVLESHENFKTPEIYPLNFIKVPLRHEISEEYVKYPYKVFETPEKQLKINFETYEQQRQQDSKTPKKYFEEYLETPEEHLQRDFKMPETHEKVFEANDNQRQQVFKAPVSLVKDEAFKNYVNQPQEVIKEPIVLSHEVFETPENLSQEDFQLPEKYMEDDYIPPVKQSQEILEKPIKRTREEYEEPPRRLQEAFDSPLVEPKEIITPEKYPQPLYEAPLKYSKAHKITNDKEINHPEVLAKQTDSYLNALPLSLVHEYVEPHAKLKPIPISTRIPPKSIEEINRKEMEESLEQDISMSKYNESDRKPIYALKVPISHIIKIDSKKGFKEKQPALANNAKTVQVTIVRVNGGPGKSIPHVSRSNKAPSSKLSRILLLDYLQPDSSFEGPEYKGNNLDEEKQVIELVKKIINVITTTESPKQKHKAKLLLFKVLDENGLDIKPIFKKGIPNENEVNEGRWKFDYDTDLKLSGIKLEEKRPLSQKHHHEQYERFGSNEKQLDSSDQTKYKQHNKNYKKRINELQILLNDAPDTKHKLRHDDIDYNGKILINNNVFKNLNLNYEQEQKSENTKRTGRMSEIMKYLEDIGLSDEKKRKYALWLLNREEEEDKENENTRQKITFTDGPTTVSSFEINDNPTNVILKILLPKHATDVQIKHLVSILPPRLREKINGYIILPAIDNPNGNTEDVKYDNVYLLHIDDDKWKKYEGKKPIINLLPVDSSYGINNDKIDNENAKERVYELFNEINDKSAKQNNKVLFDSHNLVYDKTDSETPKFDLDYRDQNNFKPTNNNKKYIFGIHQFEYGDDDDDYEALVNQKPTKIEHKMFFPKNINFQNHQGKLRRPDVNIEALYKIKFGTNKNWNKNDESLRTNYSMLPDNWPISRDDSKMRFTPEGILTIKKPNLQRVYILIAINLLKEALNKVSEYLLVYKIPTPVINEVLYQIKLEMIARMKSSDGKCLEDEFNTFLNNIRRSVAVHVLSKTKPDYVGNVDRMPHNLELR